MRIVKSSKTVYSSCANFSGNRGRIVPVWVVVTTDDDGIERCAVLGKEIRRSVMDDSILVGNGYAYDFARKRDAKAWIDKHTDD